MKKNSVNDTGIRLLIEHYRKIFRIPENLNHYAKEDLIHAERHFIKSALQNGKL